MRTLLSFIFILHVLVSQSSNDSLRLTNITYSSVFEKAYFEKMSKGPKDSLALLIAIHPSASELELTNLRKSVSTLIVSLEDRMTKESDISKRIKYLNTEVPQKVFGKFDLTATFADLLKDGRYNTVTGTALYAIICDHFKIPYEIVEKPDRVFLIADPRNKAIPLESWDANKTVFNLEEAFKAEFVSNLVNKAVLTKSMLAQNETLQRNFEKTFYLNEPLKYEQLAYLQYYLSGLNYFGLKDYNNSLLQFEKADILHSSHRSRYLLNAVVRVCIAEKKYTSLQDITTYTKAVNYIDPPANNIFVDLFEEFTHSTLLEKNQREFYDQAYNKIIRETRDSAFHHQVSLIYFKESAKAYYIQGKKDKALQDISTAHGLSPDNLLLQSMLLDLILDQLSQTSDQVAALKKLDEYSAKYAFMKDNNTVSQTYAYCYLYLASSSFESNNEKKGNEYLNLFEEHAKTKDYSKTEKILEYAYAAAWGYYVRKSQRPTAQKYIDRGLKYAPTSTELLHKKRITQESGN
jgi:hypothetical protein